jgi:O-antigen/teichoic acid export membrane protein
LRLLRRGWTEPYRRILGELMWSIAGVVSTHIHLRSYAYIATALVGLAQLAALNAVGFLFRPALILLLAWRRSALSEFAALLAAGRVEALYRKVLVAAGAALVGSAAWSAVLWLGWHTVERHLFAGKYPASAVLLLPWTIAMCLDALEYVLSTALQAARDFRYRACVTIATAPVTVAATAGLTLWHGYTWTMYGLAIGNALSATIIIVRLFGLRRHLEQGSAAAGPAALSGVG